MLKYKIQKNNNFEQYLTFPGIPAGNFRMMDSWEFLPLAALVACP